MLAALVITAFLGYATSGACDFDTKTAGLCGITNTGSSVEIGGSYEVPGTGGYDSGDSGGAGGVGLEGGTGWAPSNETEWMPPVIAAGPPAERHDARPRPLAAPAPAPECTGPCLPDTTAETLPAAPAVTITDLASFAPSPPELIGEPFGFGIVGAPTNCVTQADVHTVTGELFGRPVTVRFTPAQYVFDHGDGTTTTTTGPGTSWDALGVPQFTPTDTTHIYDARGTYLATVTVAYAAEVDTGTGWRPVAGILPVTSLPAEITVLEKRTALVQYTCIEDPRGPGCP